MINAICKKIRTDLPWEEYFFSNTYPMFRKLQEMKQPGEVLSDCLNAVFQQLGSQKTFYEMTRGESQRYFGKQTGEFCYGRLNEEIQRLFLHGERMLLETAEDGLVQLWEIRHRGYGYAFLVDRHPGKNVVILTDFYPLEERGQENLLLSSMYGKSYVEENRERHYRLYQGGRFVVINTYHAFCQYAGYRNHPINLAFNNVLFPDAIRELDDLFNQSDDRNAYQSWQHFSFVLYKNVIVVYRFNRQTCRVIKVEAV